jgi:hypothetical protein
MENYILKIKIPKIFLTMTEEELIEYDKPKPYCPAYLSINDIVFEEEEPQFYPNYQDNLTFRARSPIQEDEDEDVEATPRTRATFI